MERLGGKECLGMIMSADEAALKIKSGATVGIGGAEAIGSPTEVLRSFARMTIKGDGKDVKICKKVAEAQNIDYAIIQVSCLTENGDLCPVMPNSKGNGFVKKASKVFVEINTSEPMPTCENEVTMIRIKCGWDKIAGVIISEKEAIRKSKFQ